MTLLKISAFLLSPDEIAVSPLAQLSCIGCSDFLNNYACPLFTVHASVFRNVLKRAKQVLLLVTWLDLASRLNRLAETTASIKQALALAYLQLESYAHRTLSKHICKILSTFKHDLLMWFRPGGGCRRCKVCAAAESKPCRHLCSREPPAPEAVGVDLYTTFTRRGIYYEHPPRRVVTKTAMFLLKRNVAETELEKLDFSVEENLDRVPSLKPEVMYEIRRIEEEDRARLTTVLKSASREEVEIKPGDCKASSCPLRGAVKCRIVRKYFEKLAGHTARVLVISRSVDPIWLRQSYMRYISPLCCIFSTSVRVLRRGSRLVYGSLCRHVLGLDAAGLALVTAVV